MSTGTFAFQSAYARRLRAEGRTEAEAKAVLEVLDARGFDIPDDARARITTCSDLDQLVTWLRRAAVIRRIDELFD